MSDLEFVASTNDVFEDRGRHYVTIWMRGEPDSSEVVINDTAEIEDVGWFDPTALPAPLHSYFENLISARCLPPHPLNLPFAAEL